MLTLLGITLNAHAILISNIYVVGDSLSDQGNLRAATSSLPPPAPTLPDPLHYFNGRFSNGPVYTDYIATSLGLPLGPSIAGGTNFAYGGARTSYNTVDQQAGGPFPNGLFPWSLNAQVQDFRNRNVNDPNGLYVAFSGANDVADILRGGLNPATAVPVIVGGILNAIDAFRDAGAQRILVPNAPDLGLTPVFLQLGPVIAGLATNVTSLYNAALHQALDAISGVEIIEFDTFSQVRDLITNPGRLGITDVTTPCYTGFVVPDPNAVECSDPAAHLFWDAIHPSTKLHAELARLMLFQIPAPSTLLLLVLPLLGLIRFARTRA